jgi:F420-dependent oxidoreductase-like protein
MRVGCNVAKYTWDGGAPRMGATAGELVRLAEEVGFSTISAMDHYFQIPAVGEVDEPMLDGYTFLAFAAGLTSRVDLQLLVTGVTYRHPGLLAKVVTSLDVLSAGRARLGIGAAWFEREHEALGVPFPSLSDRFEILDETLAICRQMWSDDDGPFEGSHFRLAETLNSPQCVRSPHPPIMVGGQGERKTLKLAARHGQAVNLFPIGIEGFRHKLEVLRRHCEDEGTDFDAISVTMMSFAPDLDDGADIDRYLTDLAGYAALGVEEIFLAPTGPDPLAEVERLGAWLLPRVAEI